MAILAIEPEKRAMYAQLAAQWREMSEQAERFDRRHSAGSRASPPRTHVAPALQQNRLADG